MQENPVFDPQQPTQQMVMSPQLQQQTVNRLEKLSKEEDWRRWCYQMKFLLKRLGVFGVISGELVLSPESTAEEKAAYERADSEASYQISLSLDSEYLELIYDKTSARDMWQVLTDFFERKGADKIMFLNKRLVSEKMKSTESVDSYCQRIKSISDQLQLAGQPTNEINLVTCILAGLTHRFEYIKGGILTQPSDQLSYSKVLNLLRTAELDLKNSNQNYESVMSLTETNKAKGFKPTTKKRVCWHCQKEGHFKNQCPALRNNLEKEAEHVLAVGHLATDINKWYVDSCASAHMCRSKEFFQSLQEYETPTLVHLASEDDYVECLGVGSVYLFSTAAQAVVMLEKVLFVPSLRGNFISVPTATKNKMHIVFSDENVNVYDDHGVKVFNGYTDGKLFYLDGNIVGQQSICAVVHDYGSNIWHRRLGHVGKNVLQLLVKGWDYLHQAYQYLRYGS